MAYTLLNQIFYINKFDVDPLLCEKYMLFSDYVKTVTPLIKECIVEPLEEKQQEPKPHIQKLFTPKHQDKLFWCIFTLNIGEGEYIMINNNYKNAEIDEKKQILEHILANKRTIKSLASNNGIRLTNVKLQIIESELMVNKTTSWYAFWIMCTFYKVNIVLVQKNIYMKFHVDNEYKTYLLTRDDNFFVSLDQTEVSKERLQEIVKGKLEIDPFNDKILKGLSAYKTQELEQMCETMGVVPQEDKPKKSDYYDCVIKKLVSMKLQN
jgi:hypothetical protein